MAELNDKEIAASLRTKLMGLLKEEKEEEAKRKVRIEAIKRTKLALEAYSEDGIEEELQEMAAEADYNYPKGSWKDKIVSYLSYKNRVSTPAEIQRGIEKYEQGYTPERLRAALAGELSKMVKRDELKQFKPNGMKMKGFYYGSPQWFDENGQLKDEHLPIKRKADLWILFNK